MPDWKAHLPKENVFNISVRLTPGGLGEGSKWAVVMPKELNSSLQARLAHAKGVGRVDPLL